MTDPSSMSLRHIVALAEAAGAEGRRLSHAGDEIGAILKSAEYARLCAAVAAHVDLSVDDRTCRAELRAMYGLRDRRPS